MVCLVSLSLSPSPSLFLYLSLPLSLSLPVSLRARASGIASQHLRVFPPELVLYFKDSQQLLQFASLRGMYILEVAGTDFGINTSCAMMWSNALWTN